MIKYDGHVHTPYCPHGSNDPLEKYVETAIKQGFNGITFTEHAPLPDHFTDPAPTRDSCMKAEDFEMYIKDIETLKHTYRNKFEIRTGLEVDYILGFEAETKKLLNTVGPYLDDSILSVHFLCRNNTYYCMDYSSEVFSDLVDTFGSLEATYEEYFKTVRSSIEVDLGQYKPKRIGHITLVNKFQKNFPNLPNYSNRIKSLLELMKEKNYELDYNGSGVVKPDCGETYPPSWVIMEATKLNIPLVYGSDAHTAKGIGQGRKELVSTVKYSTPKRFNSL
jgi:histidinol-phosphatase (PHP family)